MLPKNSKHYITPTGEELDVDPVLVEKVIDFYYKTVRKSLVDLKCQNIMLENLGTFKIKKKELPKLITKHTRHLNVLSKETFNQMSLRKDVEKRLQKAVVLKKNIDIETARRKQFFKNKRDGKLQCMGNA